MDGETLVNRHEEQARASADDWYIIDGIRFAAGVDRPAAEEFAAMIIRNEQAIRARETLTATDPLTFLEHNGAGGTAPLIRRHRIPYAVFSGHQTPADHLALRQQRQFGGPRWPLWNPDNPGSRSVVVQIGEDARASFIAALSKALEPDDCANLWCEFHGSPAEPDAEMPMPALVRVERAPKPQDWGGRIRIAELRVVTYMETAAVLACLTEDGICVRPFTHQRQ